MKLSRNVCSDSIRRSLAMVLLVALPLISCGEEVTSKIAPRPNRISVQHAPQLGTEQFRPVRFRTSEAKVSNPQKTIPLPNKLTGKKSDHESPEVAPSPSPRCSTIIQEESCTTVQIILVCDANCQQNYWAVGTYDTGAVTKANVDSICADITPNCLEHASGSPVLSEFIDSSGSSAHVLTFMYNFEGQMRLTNIRLRLIMDSIGETHEDVVRRFLIRGYVRYPELYALQERQITSIQHASPECPQSILLEWSVPSILLLPSVNPNFSIVLMPHSIFGGNSVVLKTAIHSAELSLCSSP